MCKNLALELVKNKYGFNSLLTGLRFASIQSIKVWSYYLYNLILNETDLNVILLLKSIYPVI